MTTPRHKHTSKRAASSETHRLKRTTFVLRIHADFATAATSPTVGFCKGSHNRKHVPLSTTLLPSIRPPCFFTIPYDSERPSPVPCPTGLVVKNGSKIRFICSGGVAVTE